MENIKFYGKYKATIDDDGAGELSTSYGKIEIIDFYDVEMTAATIDAEAFELSEEGIPLGEASLIAKHFYDEI